METQKIMSFKAILLLLLFSGVLAKDDLDPSTILKTIVSGKETIDCVDIYKQPAFNHPLLKNHTLQLKPSSYPVGSNSRVSTELTQTWHESGEICPEGTVAILRSPAKNTTSNYNPNAKPSYNFDNYATASMLAPTGASADLNVWKPRVGKGEVTVAQVRVSDGRYEWVEAGWRVGPGGSQNEPVLYSYWTTRETGCFDLTCPGFVQVTRKFGFGAKITPISTYGGPQYQYNIKIYKDIKSGDWWLLNGDTQIGYWPKKLFGSLGDPLTTQVEWGGKATKIYRSEIVEMGSGHFSGEGLGKAAFVANLEYADENGNWNKAPVDLKTDANRRDCYDIKSPEYKDGYGTLFFYGGDGKACSRE